METATSALLDLFRSHGHELKKEGKSYKTCCPFHNDKSPSLLIDPERGLWNCFGCEAGGDGITFLQKTLGLSFGEAADEWKKLSGQDPVFTKPREAISEMRQLSTGDLVLLARLQEIYADSLAKSSQAQSFLRERGLTDGETIRAFGLGFVSGNSLPQLAPAQRACLQDLGLLNSKGNESLYNCIVCPLYNREGQVVSFWGRRILEINFQTSVEWAGYRPTIDIQLADAHDVLGGAYKSLGEESLADAHDALGDAYKSLGEESKAQSEYKIASNLR